MYQYKTPEVTPIYRDIIERLNKVAQTSSDEHANFWTAKSPCWEMCHCPAMIREECPAPKYQFIPCWQIEGTYCKLDDYGQSGTDTSICEVCRVYKKYGNGEQIELKLLGRGIDSSLKSLEKTANL
ncbi:MAG: hypothetical protein NT082_03345 [Chloroflexi bacterium]|nr:hypothetical protein [Chloroflexota bacterium]